MNNKSIADIELKTGCCAIELSAEGIYVFYEPRNTKHIVIAGQKGTTKLNRAQALALANELKGIIEMYMEDK